MNASPIVEDMLRQEAKHLPPTWGDPHSEKLTNSAREELAWSLLLYMLYHLLFRDPLPNTIRAGREHVPFSLDKRHWHVFESELGLHIDEARQQFVACLASIVRRESTSLVTVLPAPKLAAGLVHLLNGFSKHGRGGRRTSPRQGSLGFDSATPERDNPAALVDDLITWAGNAGTTPEDRYRIAFHVLWRPLSRRSWSDAAAPIDAVPSRLELPLDFLLRAREEEARAHESMLSDWAAADEGTALVPSPCLPTHSEMPKWAHAQEALAVLLEPMLQLRGEPAAVVAAAEVTAHGFAKDMLRTWRRLFLNDELRFFGEPGSVIDIRLPDPLWLLAKVPFRQSATDRPQRVMVVRRGVLLKNEILLPGVVVIKAAAKGDVR